MVAGTLSFDVWHVAHLSVSADVTAATELLWMTATSLTAWQPVPPQPGLMDRALCLTVRSVWVLG